VEKVISEFRIVETDDGYRIEIKGDKEAIKATMRGFPFRHGHRGPGHFFFIYQSTILPTNLPIADLQILDVRGKVVKKRQSGSRA